MKERFIVFAVLLCSCANRQANISFSKAQQDSIAVQKFMYQAHFGYNRKTAIECYNDSILKLIDLIPFRDPKFRDSQELGINLIYLKENLYQIDISSTDYNVIIKNHPSHKLADAYIFYNHLDSAQIYQRERGLDMFEVYEAAKVNNKLLRYPDVEKIICETDSILSRKIKWFDSIDNKTKI